jgi:predicted cupin superfamily sugar epimerase
VATTGASIRPQPPAGTRPALSAIHFLLAAGEASAWHRVDAEEAWQFVEGDPLELLIYPPQGDRLQRHRLGPLSDLADDAAAPIHVVPAGAWQAARPLGAYTLCTCLVAPAFDFTGFQLLDDPALVARLRELERRR